MKLSQGSSPLSYLQQNPMGFSQEMPEDMAAFVKNIEEFEFKR